ncbi:MAG: hypothetical protein QM489_01020 [Candidatus Izemoplasma sp.]
MDCYMTGLWADDIKQAKAIEFFSLYLKNWKEGLTLEEWRNSKLLKAFWLEEINKPVEE